MINKKTVFQFVYAIALVGAVLSCIGILNELLNIGQLYGIHINSVGYIKKEDYFVPFAFYLAAFVISALVALLLVLRTCGAIKRCKKTVSVLVLAACAVLIALSVVFVFVLREESNYYANGTLGYFNYMHYYAFRTVVMSFVANAGIVWVCDLLDGKRKKAQESAAEIVTENAAE